jgi:hypothetical protein
MLVYYEGYLICFTKKSGDPAQILADKKRVEEADLSSAASADWGRGTRGRTRCRGSAGVDLINLFRP